MPVPAGGSSSAGGPGQTTPWPDGLRSVDPLSFPAYAPPPSDEESVRVALVELGRGSAVWIDVRFSARGGTMGVVAGERIVQAFDRATALGLPVVATIGTGGARLQVGMLSLIQMSRTTSALARHRAAGLRSAGWLRNPCTGGVFVSWASLLDLRAAEPGATIGFGGPRVVQQVTGALPPATSHTAESALQHGLVDEIVTEEDSWCWLAAAVGLGPWSRLGLPDGRASAPEADPVPADQYDVVVRCRRPERASGLEWASWLTTNWVEIAGADPAVRAGLATVSDVPCVVVAMDRHAGLDPERLPRPEAFQLARRAVELAGRAGLPVLTLVDTPGADPAPESEAGGIGRSIAELLLAMATCPAPTVCLTVGEGGSGGAVAFAHADRFLMLEGAIFSVIGPEAGAAILYRDASRAADLSRVFGLTARELLELDVVDDIVAEDVDAVRELVLSALSSAQVGDRDLRPTTATLQALATDPSNNPAER